MRTGSLITRTLRRMGASLILLLMLLLAAACAADQDLPAAPAAVLPANLGDEPATAVPATATPAPTVTSEPTATPPPTATHTPTPTATPLPLAVLAVPVEWEEAAIAAINTLRASDSLSFSWELLVADDPQGAIEEGTAQVGVQPGDSGQVVRDEPVALAVPFTTNWERVNRLEGDAILTGGHRLAQPILWEAMTPDLKALRVDGLHPTDEGYPYRQRWSLTAVGGYEAAVAELTPHLAAEMAAPLTIRLAAVGDINLDRTLGTVISQGNLDYPFALVAPVLQAADYTTGNFESALGDIGEPVPKSYPFQSPPAAAEALARAGFDLVSLANNHAQDYGPEALLQGIDLLHEQGVATVGAGANDTVAYAPHISTIGNLRVAHFGYVHVPIEAVTNFDTASWTATANAPGLAWADPERIRRDVAAVTEEVDLVIVQLHSGYEYIEEPSKPQVAAAYAAIEGGADLVIGHHAHILQGVQRYLDGVIVYGLGNFAFTIDGPPETAILNAWLDDDGVRQLEIVPGFVQEGGQPRLAEVWESGPIMERLHYLTILLNAQPPSPELLP